MTNPAQELINRIGDEYTCFVEAITTNDTLSIAVWVDNEEPLSNPIITALAKQHFNCPVAVHRTNMAEAALTHSYDDWLQSNQ